MAFQTVCDVDEIVEGRGERFVVDDVSIALFLLAGNFRAIQDACPHAGASLACGYVEGDTVRCRIHHWGFSLDSGQCDENPAEQFRAQTFPTRIVDGKLQVDVG